jgi:MscS family membrane protein
MLEYFLGNGKWILECLVGIVALVILNALVRYGVRALLYRADLIPPRWQAVLDRAFWGPFHLLLTVFGAVYVTRIVLRQIGADPADPLIGQLRDVGILISVVWFITVAIREWRRRALLQKGARREERATVDLVSKLISVVLWITVGLMLLQSLGLPLTGLLALGTIAGGGLAFAAKDVTSNFFGGVMLYITRPFVVGDKISIPDKKLEGTVEEIGWYLTQLRTSDRMPVFVPNASFLTMVLANVSRQSHRLIKEVLVIPQIEPDLIPKLIASLRQVIRQSPDIDHQQKQAVHFAHLGTYGLEVELVAYTRETDDASFFKARTELLTRSIEVLEDLGIRLVHRSVD